MTKSTKIVALTAENVKRISAVHIEPGDDGCVLIGGRNAQGKSSVLDSIMYALGGASSLPDEPIRHGEESAEITVDLGDIIVRRKFTASGSTVTVKTVDGASYSSPQKVLDGLFSKLSFDPLAFASMKPAEQSKSLIALLGIDTSELDKEFSRLYEERTGVNRLVKEAEADLARCEEILIEVPETRPDVSEISSRIVSAVESNTEVERHQRAIAGTKATIEECENELATLKPRLEAIESEYQDDKKIQEAQRDVASADMQTRHDREIAELKERQQSERNRFNFEWTDNANRLLKLSKDERERIETHIANLTAAIAGNTVALAELEAATSAALIDVEAIRKELAVAEEAMHAFDVAEDRKEKKQRLKNRQEESEELTDQMDLIVSKKRQRLAEANYPIAGLAVNDEGTVLFDGVPLSQASRAQQIRTSVAIGIAMNPKLKVLLIRDGSLLDEENMQLVAEMAKHHDAQIWIERVGDKDASAIVIEDGHVRGVQQAADDVPTEPKPKKSRKKVAEQSA